MKKNSCQHYQRLFVIVIHVSWWIGSAFVLISEWKKRNSKQEERGHWGLCVSNIKRFQIKFFYSFQLNPRQSLLSTWLSTTYYRRDLYISGHGTPPWYILTQVDKTFLPCCPISTFSFLQALLRPTYDDEYFYKHFLNKRHKLGSIEN